MSRAVDNETTFPGLLERGPRERESRGAFSLLLGSQEGSIGPVRAPTRQRFHAAVPVESRGVRGSSRTLLAESPSSSRSFPPTDPADISVKDRLVANLAASDSLYCWPLVRG
jgi:hypothetical protein